jgi:hypothetical protein
MSPVRWLDVAQTAVRPGGVEAARTIQSVLITPHMPDSANPQLIGVRRVLVTEDDADPFIVTRSQTIRTSG